MFVVSGADVADQALEGLVRRDLRSLESQLTITSPSGLPTGALKTRLATLPEHSIVYFLLVSRDGAGENVHPLEYVDQVTAVASAPTYSWVDSTMSHGIMGGRLKNQVAEAAAVGELALRVLQGEQADSIPRRSSPVDDEIQGIRMDGGHHRNSADPVGRRLAALANA